MTTCADVSALRALRTRVQANSFNPLGTVKCAGNALFRSQAARDLACLLDLDRNVRTWRCLPASLSLGDIIHFPDFLVIDIFGSTSLVDSFDNVTELSSDELEHEADLTGLGFRTYSRSDIYDGVRLANAKDVLRYASFKATLSDRVRLLATLSEEGSIAFSECWRVLPGRDAVAVVAALFLQGFVDFDWETEALSPETLVKRIAE